MSELRYTVSPDAVKELQATMIPPGSPHSIRGNGMPRLVGASAPTVLTDGGTGSGGSAALGKTHLPSDHHRISVRRTVGRGTRPPRRGIPLPRPNGYSIAPELAGEDYDF